MRNGRVSEGSAEKLERRALRAMCPGGLYWTGGQKRKQYEIDERGRIYFDGAWRRIPAVIKKRLARVEADRRRYAENAEFRERKNASRRDHYERHGQKTRKKWKKRWADLPAAARAEINKRRLEQARADERRNEKQREWYHAKRRSRLNGIRRRRDELDPARIINRAAADLRAGKIRVDECARRLDSAIALADEAPHLQPRESPSVRRPRGRR